MAMNNRKIAVVGLGYVGLTIANAFAKHHPVLCFDISEKRISELKKGFDRNNELASEELSNPNLIYSTDADDLDHCNFFISTVLTPISEQHRPDLTILLKATKMVGEHLKKGDVVVYESTIYPGATEEECIPLLEKTSGLRCPQDFGVGYSPERINPGDREHPIEEIPKIISAIDEDTLKIIQQEYQKIIKTLHPVSKMAVAEAAKIVENVQRDMNISILNEISLLLHKMNLDSKEVFSAAGTKWNFLPFHPGLVGGHCIGVNTYYLTHKAEQIGFYPDLLLAGRRVNEYIPLFIASTTIKELIRKDIKVKEAKIGVLGLTYKADSPDLHYSKVLQIVNELKSYDIQLFIHDALADDQQVKAIYHMPMTSLSNFKQLDAILILVSHDLYRQFSIDDYKSMLKKDGLIMDVNGILYNKRSEHSTITIWSL